LRAGAVADREAPSFKAFTEALRGIARKRCVSGEKGYREPDELSIDRDEAIARSAAAAVLRGLVPFHLDAWIAQMDDADGTQNPVDEMFETGASKPSGGASPIVRGSLAPATEPVGRRILLLDGKFVDEYPLLAAAATTQGMLGLRALKGAERCAVEAVARRAAMLRQEVAEAESSAGGDCDVTAIAAWYDMFGVTEGVQRILRERPGVHTFPADAKFVGLR
jgi:hypothetical protein